MNDLNQLAADIEQASRDLESGVMEAEDYSLDYAEQLVHQYSRGTETPESLATKDHPYAARHGAPQLDPSVINKQSGEFESAWRKFPATRMGSMIASSLINFSRVADFLQAGTRRMFARPIDVRVGEETAPIRLQNLGEAEKRAFNKFK